MIESRSIYRKALLKPSWNHSLQKHEKLPALQLRYFALLQQKRSFFQAFIPDGEAIAIPVQHLHPIPAAIEEDEVALKKLTRERPLNQSSKPIEALAHIDGVVKEEDSDLI